MGATLGPTCSDTGRGAGSASVLEFGGLLAPCPTPLFARDLSPARAFHCGRRAFQAPAAMPWQTWRPSVVTGTTRDADARSVTRSETNALAAPRTTPAFAASSFGAGFGGSVWAMVHATSAAVVERWQAKYLSSTRRRSGDGLHRQTMPAASELFCHELRSVPEGSPDRACRDCESRTSCDHQIAGLAAVP